MEMKWFPYKDENGLAVLFLCQLYDFLFVLYKCFNQLIICFRKYNFMLEFSVINEFNKYFIQVFYVQTISVLDC